MTEMLSYLNDNRALFTKISDSIWDYAELAYRETKSSALLKATLLSHGFSLREDKIAELETAFCVEAGSGRPIIAFLGEFDALPDLSQKTNVLGRDPIVEHGAGHGCGHHILGTAAMAAAMATKEYLQQHDLPGTVRFYGCPAEEGGSGKVFMARVGTFHDVDAALTWHPADDNNIWSMNFLASQNLRFYFSGISAHAASQGHIGRSALEGVELMSVGANYLRGHVERDVCINYAVLDAGGTAANNFPAEAAVAYKIRANTTEKALAATERLKQIAQGAALMSGTTVRVEHLSGSSELIPNRTLEWLMYEKLVAVGPPSFTEADRQFAAKIRTAFPTGAEESTVSILRMLYGEAAEEIIPQIVGKDINDVIYPYTPIARAKYGSTDVCDVSWFTPVAQVTTACYAKDTPGHSWYQVAQGKNTLCHNGMLTAAKVLALTGIALYEQPETLREARTEWEKKRKGKPYHDPAPEKPHPAIHTMK